MLGMMGGGMGGMGGGMMGGMGGMGGGMMGGMGGGFRSVPPTGERYADLEPHQVRHLPTSVVSLNPPGANGQALIPAAGEALRVSGIDEATDDVRTRNALKKLTEANAPQTISQMVLWYVTSGANWDDIGRLSQGWGNAYEIALARQFVARLDSTETKPAAATSDSGILYWEIKAEGDRANKLTKDLRELWSKYPVLGLTTKEGTPADPKNPALSCRFEVTDSAINVKLSASHASGAEWVDLGSFKINASPELLTSAPKFGDAVTEGILARVVRVQLSHGPRDKGKETFRVKIVNNSPLILNGLALTGTKADEKSVPSLVSGLSIPPLKSLTIGASSDLVSRLHLKDGIRVTATDLSGL